MPKHLVVIATLFLLTVSAFCQTSPPDLPYDVAPWPAGDSVRMPGCPEVGKLVGGSAYVDVLLYVDKQGCPSPKRIEESPRGLEYADSVESVLRAWWFTPAALRGNAIESWVPLHFRFESMGEDSTQNVKMLRPGFQTYPGPWVRIGSQETRLQIYQPPSILYERPPVK